MISLVKVLRKGCCLQDRYIASLRSDVEAVESQLISLATEASSAKMYVANTFVRPLVV